MSAAIRLPTIRKPLVTVNSKLVRTPPAIKTPLVVLKSKSIRNAAGGQVYTEEYEFNEDLDQ